MASTWNETHGGTANAGKIGVLIGGAKLNTIAISPEDAEWLDSKRFTVSEIARFYGVPPHLIADASNSTSWGSGLAEQNLAFGQFSLRPDVTRIEDGHDRLLYTHGAGGVFTKLNLDALLRASLSDRYEAYKVGIDAGFLDDDEVRALEDLPPREPGVETATLAPEEIAIMLQKIYLSVGVLITPEEAREIMNRAGAGLTGAWPGGTQ
jgi:HK97 family phage portal protein